MTIKMLPAYDLISSETARQIIIGRLSEEFNHYIPVESNYKTKDFDVLEYVIDLDPIQEDSVLLSVPLDLEHSFNGDRVAKPVLLEKLKNLIKPIVEKRK